MRNWTRETIAALLESSDRAVERAMVALYRLQTEEEQAQETTRVHNGCGFSAFHAGRGTYYARWVLSGRNLSGSHLDKARAMARRYVGQLTGIAQGSLKEPSHV